MEISDWKSGNELRLLENGEAFFPRLFEAIEAARHEILIETFIWFEDEVGRDLLQALVKTAHRGVHIRVLVDGYGSPGFTSTFLAQLADAGIRVDAFDPRRTLFRFRTNLLRRMHRKIVVVDRKLAFIGGLNFSADHLRSFGDESKQDYAVEVAGPVVRDIHAFCRYGAELHGGAAWKRWRYWLRRFPDQMANPQEPGQALFVYRDNDRHPTDIETMYRAGIRNAQENIVIASAYFFPGYRFVRDLRNAADRGVDVTLIMQGKPDRPLTVSAASILYDELLSVGVRIYKYRERPLHAKVAVIDRHWATVGSSNLDPLSFGLNLEANLFVLDRQFNAELRQSLETLIARSCTEFTADGAPRRSILRRLALTLGYHLTRKMPTWGQRPSYRKQLVRPMKSKGRDPRKGGD